LLLAANAMPYGYGVPCALAPTLPKCNNPLPDNGGLLDLGGKQVAVPGLLYPSEVALLKTRIAEYNAQIRTLAGGAGYKIFDTGAFFADFAANGREWGGMPVTSAYLQGGFFSYDGVHPTSLGYAIVANEAINFINQNFNASIPQVDLSVYLFNGSSTTGGFPTGMAMTQDDVLNFAAAYWTPENRKAWQQLFGLQLGHLAISADEETPVHEVRPEMRNR
jgi:phospholipase/lecithinase/hemolysin